MTVANGGASLEGHVAKLGNRELTLHPGRKNRLSTFSFIGKVREVWLVQ
jgi:hypothetical protein